MLASAATFAVLSVKGIVFEVGGFVLPPSTTVTATTVRSALEARSEAVTLAVSVDGSTNVVDRGVPFQRTFDALLNPVPVTLKVSAGPFGPAEDGSRPMINVRLADNTGLSRTAWVWNADPMRNLSAPAISPTSLMVRESIVKLGKRSERYSGENALPSEKMGRSSRTGTSTTHPE